MDILWLAVKMLIYGFLIGMIICVGAFFYALIAIHFAKEERRRGEEMKFSLQQGIKTSSGNG